MLRSTLLALAGACALAACQSEDGNDAAPAPENANAQGNQAAERAPAKGTILDTLSQSGEHGTLANAIKAAGLTETMSGAQPYTVFAPTDAAFEKLPPGTANGLLEPDRKGELVTLLTGHIVPGVVTAADLSRAIDKGKGKAQLATVGGTSLSFARDGDAIFATDGQGGSARIVRSDLLQSNGVVHSLDTVLAASE